jgi:amino acid transporter
VIANDLCALAGMTSLSRMIFAFARDGGFPASNWLRLVSPTHRTPVHAIWIGAVLAFISTLYTPQFWTLASAARSSLSLLCGTDQGRDARRRQDLDERSLQLGALSSP